MFGGGLTALLAYVFRNGAREQAAALWPVWRSVAEAQGGSFKPGTKWRAYSCTMEVDGVTVDIRSTGGKHPTLYTRWRGSVRSEYFPEFRVYREGRRQALGKRLGFQDCVLGVNATFDDRFMVKTGDAPAVRSLWQPELQALMLNFPNVTTSAENGRMVLELLGVVHDPDILTAAFGLVLALRGSDVAGVGALSELSSVAGIETGRPSTEINLPSRIRVATEECDGVLCSVASRVDAIDLADTTGSISDGAFSEATAVELPQASHQHLAAVGRATLAILDGHAALRWPTVQADVEVLRAGAVFLSALGRAGGGAYR